jgi:hypothetical protein
MKKIFLAVALLTFVGCRSKDKQPEPQQPQCYDHQHLVGGVCVDKPIVVAPCGVGEVRNADGHCVIPMPQSDYCNPVGKQIECEAQFSMQDGSPKCRKFDGSDWAPAFFKDFAELDAYGKAHRFAFRINRGTPDVAVYGTTESVFPWECYPKK